MNNEILNSSVNGYGLVFKNVMKDTSLDIEAKALYAYLSAYAGSEGVAFPSVSLICGELNVSEKRYKKYRKQLEDAGYLTVSRKRTDNGFSKNIYTIDHNGLSGQNVTITKEEEASSVSGRFVTEQIVPGQNVSERFVPVQNVGTTINSLTSNSIKNNSNTNNNSTTTAAAVDDESFQKLFDFFESKINAVQAIKIIELLEQDLARYGFELVMYAMEQSLLYNKTSYGYVTAVLKRCEAENITTREQAEYRANQNSNNGQKKKQEPKWIEEMAEGKEPQSSESTSIDEQLALKRQLYEFEGNEWTAEIEMQERKRIESKGA